ncbi:ABC transporter substrate-binding protein [Lichenihabitans sp. Uapishka_5]|uniref:ABC transporter substrate-binding protein n=1 Tax=Lichenihabitans sp. Uapishka_5 TaxID=3037302 RepID=UPI0029E80B13|nr:ABC transporter substrate-binding protein [Lichenihabitans sp. Uapishka_5]MDX7950550.1 ABC transporter substrate-binding protein [Lichenihabitans sp. Uapishka_5]
MTQAPIPNGTISDDAAVEQAIRNGASRRDLLRLLMAGGIAASAGTTILGRAGSALAAEPKSGGALKAAGYSSSNADTLDPAKSSVSTDYVRICAFYNRLTFLDQAGVAQMELADSFDTTDAKVWTIKLKKGVTFHDGKTLSAADVIFSLKRHLDPSVGSKLAKIAKQMVGFKAVDPLTVEITLEQANADLPTILSMLQFMIVADGTTDFSKGNGTGPFVLQVFEPGVRSIGVKNKSYFKSGKPYVDSFEFFAIADDTARTNALLSGDIHLAAAINPRSMHLVDRQPGFKTLQSTSGGYTDLNIRLDLSPGDKQGFIEGMKYLVNREAIKKSVLRDLAVIGNDQPISPANPYYNAELKPKAFDPDRAKHLFDKAGVLGQTIPIVAAEAADDSVEMATVVQQAGADIGMKFDIQRVPSDGYWDKYWLVAPVHFGNINPRPTADILFSLLYASDAPWNESRFKSEKFDSMLHEARGLLDQAKRKQIYGDMQVMVSEQAGTIVPAFIANVDGFTDKMKGLEANPLGGMMGYVFAEHVWLES